MPGVARLWPAAGYRRILSLEVSGPAGAGLIDGVVAMDTAKRWTVDIYIGEHGDERQTRAEARLRTGDRTDLRGVGVARRNPHDREVPEIGDELAVARALDDLAQRLREAAAGDIEQITHEQVRFNG